jgi:sugar phosphate isomerase/epimerase
MILAMSANIPIGLQLYSVRHASAQDLLGVIAKVAAMGYSGVEFAGYHGQDAKAIRQALDDNGLVAAGTHIGIDHLQPEQAAATEDFHSTIGCKWLIIPWLAEDLRNSPESAIETGKKLTELSDAWRGKGFSLGFHAHDGDMKPLADGKSAWDHLAANTPNDFILQYDTANGMAGGADPVQPILDWPGRNRSLHLKGYAGGHGAIIGQDDIPWQRVFEAAESTGGTEWYIVEHELAEETALSDVELCLKNLREMGK